MGETVIISESRAKNFTLILGQHCRMHSPTRNQYLLLIPWIDILRAPKTSELASLFAGRSSGGDGAFQLDPLIIDWSGALH